MQRDSCLVPAEAVGPVWGVVITTLQYPSSQGDILARLWVRPFTSPWTESKRGSKQKCLQVVSLSGTFSSLCQTLAPAPRACSLLALPSLESGSFRLWEFSQSTQSSGQVCNLRCSLLSASITPRALAAWRLYPSQPLPPAMSLSSVHRSSWCQAMRPSEFWRLEWMPRSLLRRRAKRWRLWPPRAPRAEALLKLVKLPVKLAQTTQTPPWRQLVRGHCSQGPLLQTWVPSSVPPGEPAWIPGGLGGFRGVLSSCSLSRPLVTACTAVQLLGPSSIPGMRDCFQLFIDLNWDGSGWDGRRVVGLSWGDIFFIFRQGFPGAPAAAEGSENKQQVLLLARSLREDQLVPYMGWR